jgi:hypothetical protein
LPVGTDHTSWNTPEPFSPDPNDKLALRGFAQQKFHSLCRNAGSLLRDGRPFTEIKKAQPWFKKFPGPPLDFTWQLVELFAKCLDLVAQYWDT